MNLNFKPLAISFVLIFFLGQFTQCKESKSEPEANTEVAEVTNEPAVQESQAVLDESVAEDSDDVKVKELKKSDLPNDIKYDGEFLKGFSFSDKEGDKILVMSQFTKNDPSVSKYGGTIKMYGQLYTQSGKSYKRTWLMQDFEEDCELDNVAEFHKEFPLITDLDNNGIYEVWILYYLGCGDDIAPKNMKLLMYEGAKKHAMRGEQTLIHVYGDDDTRLEGGIFKFDDAFEKSSQTFKDYAESLWNGKGTEEIDWRD